MGGHIRLKAKISGTGCIGVAIIAAMNLTGGAVVPSAHAGPDCFIGQITKVGDPAVSPVSPTATQTVTSSGGSWVSCNMPFTGFYKRWLRNGVVIEGPTWVPSYPNSFTYVVTTTDIATGIRSEVEPCNAEGCYGSFAPSNTITPVNRVPTTPGSLSPGEDLEETSTTPTLSATFSDPDGHSGWVRFRIWRVWDGELVAEGDGAAVPSGGTSAWTVPANILDEDTEYDWEATAIDALGGNSSMTPARVYRPTRGTISYYADDTDMNFWLQAGRRLGNEVLTGQIRVRGGRLFVILDWGAQARQNGVWGTITPDDFLYQTNGDIRRAGQQFGRGFYEGTNGAHWAHLRIVFGTNNSGQIANSGYDAGRVWAQMVTAANDWFRSNGPPGWRFSQQVFAQGANDVESGEEFCDPDPPNEPPKPPRQCPLTARAWADGYRDNTAQNAFFNFGDCPGCPENAIPTGNEPVGAAGAGWTVNDIYYISWGNGKGWPVPQIYRRDGTQAAQWERLAEYAYASPRRERMKFTAALSQHGSCLPPENHCVVGGTLDNTAGRAFGQMRRALNTTDFKNNHPAPWYVKQRDRPKFSTDIRHTYPY